MLLSVCVVCEEDYRTGYDNIVERQQLMMNKGETRAEEYTIDCLKVQGG